MVFEEKKTKTNFPFKTEFITFSENGPFTVHQDMDW